MGKLVETLLEGLERRLAFSEHVERVRQEAEQEHGVPCDVLWFNDDDPGPDTRLMVIIGRIKKPQQQRIDVGGAA